MEALNIRESSFKGIEGAKKTKDSKSIKRIAKHEQIIENVNKKIKLSKSMYAMAYKDSESYLSQ